MRAVVIFTIIYTVVLVGYGYAVDSPLTNTYLGINLLLFALFAVLHRWAKWPLHALWAVSLIGLGNIIGGVLLVAGRPLYEAEIIGAMKYDKIFHAVGGAGFVVIVWEGLKTVTGEGYHLGGMMVATFLIVLGGGAVVEIAELIGSSISDVSVGDYGNNALDLVANTVGAAIVTGLVWRYELRKPSS